MSNKFYDTDLVKKSIISERDMDKTLKPIAVRDL